jgi:hypothetical protein
VPAFDTDPKLPKGRGLSEERQLHRVHVLRCIIGIKADLACPGQRERDEASQRHPSKASQTRPGLSVFCRTANSGIESSGYLQLAICNTQLCFASHTLLCLVEKDGIRHGDAMPRHAARELIACWHLLPSFV